MGRLARVIGLDRPRQLWQIATRGASLPESRWFIARFMVAAGRVADRWGPERLRSRILGASIGAWLLALFWISVPIVGLLIVLTRS